MALLRFMSPRDADLDLPAVPVTFVNGVADINQAETARLSRMRYLGTPYGVQEMNGSVEITGEIDPIQIAAGVEDANSPIGMAVFLAAISAVGAKIVFHGTNQATPRPDVQARVIWFGTQEPNQIDGSFDDIFIPIATGGAGGGAGSLSDNQFAALVLDTGSATYAALRSVFDPNLP